MEITMKHDYIKLEEKYEKHVCSPWATVARTQVRIGSGICNIVKRLCKNRLSTAHTPIWLSPAGLINIMGE